MIALGAGIAFIAAVASAAAAVLQAAEARRTPVHQQVRFSLLRVLLRRPRWVLGTALLVLAWPLQVVALLLAPITVVQPTLATFPVVLLVFARYVLHERVGRQDLFGVAAIIAGIVLVVVEAPGHTARNPPASHLIGPLTVVGVAALVAYAISRVGRGGSNALAVGAGLAYAWVDFANKLLSNAISSDHWILAGIWLAAVLAMGALAFLQENAALQRGRAVQVSPLISAVQDPLPVVMAVWSGVETWGSDSSHITMLSAGLALVVIGAQVLRRSGVADTATGPGLGTAPAGD